MRVDRLIVMAKASMDAARAAICVGCCGAYCKTCMGSENPCEGCRLGYEDGTRSVLRARCKIKRCCLIEKELPTCMECDEFESCEILQDFYNHPRATAHQKIRRAAEFIRKHGYDRFEKIAGGWTGSKGELPDI